MLSLQESLMESMHKIPKGDVKHVGLFACFNSNGSKPPIFWCFNNWAEPVFLANRLEPEQPLFAMRSFHGLITGKQNKRANTLDLAKLYVDQLLPLIKNHPILIGGNCQAAPIAEAMAHNVLAREGKKALLMTLEYNPFYSYSGSILMMFGANSEKYNPFLKLKDPVTNWKLLHQSPAWGIVNGTHGKFFMEPGVLDLVSFIEQATALFCQNNSLISTDSETKYSYDF